MVFAIGLWVLTSIASATPDTQTSDTTNDATVELVLGKWVEVTAEPITTGWAQGIDAHGNPNGGSGEDPTFIGGDAVINPQTGKRITDTWADGNTWHYARGAVARSPLHIKANCRWSAKIDPSNIKLLLSSGGTGPVLDAYAGIGFQPANPSNPIQITGD